MTIERGKYITYICDLDEGTFEDEYTLDEFIKKLRKNARAAQSRGVVDIFVHEGELQGWVPEDDETYAKRVAAEKKRLAKEEERERKELERLKQKYEGGEQ